MKPKIDGVKVDLDIPDDLLRKIDRILDDLGVIGGCRLVYYIFADHLLYQIERTKKGEVGKVAEALKALYSEAYVDRDTHLRALDGVCTVILERV